MSLTFISLFAGIGGFDLGLERAGLRCVAQVEIDKDCHHVLNRRWPDVPKHRDVRDVGRHNLPDCDVITFGSPCQDLSVAGRRGGLDGERSGLFYEAIRICQELRPAFAVWENVPGAFSSNTGRDFAAVLAAFRDCGARDIAWRVLDAQYFGVAQRRRRVFLVADFGGERAAQILFEPAGRAGYPAPRRETGQGVTGSTTGRAWGIGGKAGAANADVSNRSHATGGPSGMGITEELAPSLRAGRTMNVGYADLAAPLVARQAKGAFTDPVNDNVIVANAITASAGHHGHSSPRGDGSDNLVIGLSGELVPNHEHIGALDAGSRSGGGQPAMAMVQHGVRRLTPVECERLQGFPDGHTAGQSDSARYRQLGNAVCVPVAEWIGKRMKEARQ